MDEPLPLTPAIEEVLTTAARSTDDIGAVHIQEIFSADRFQIAMFDHGAAEPGIVEQRVDPAIGQSGGNDAAAIRILADIAPYDHRFSPRGTDSLGGNLRFTGAAGIVDDDRAGTPFGRANGDGAAKTGGCACDHHHGVGIWPGHLCLPSALHPKWRRKKFTVAR
jgi:hypothetical protein